MNYLLPRLFKISFSSPHELKIVIIFFPLGVNYDLGPAKKPVDRDHSFLHSLVSDLF